MHPASPKGPAGGPGEEPLHGGGCLTDDSDGAAIPVSGAPERVEGAQGAVPALRRNHRQARPFAGRQRGRCLLLLDVPQRVPLHPWARGGSAGAQSPGDGVGGPWAARSGSAAARSLVRGPVGPGRLLLSARWPSVTRRTRRPPNGPPQSGGTAHRDDAPNLSYWRRTKGAPQCCAVYSATEG